MAINPVGGIGAGAQAGANAIVGGKGKNAAVYNPAKGPTPSLPPAIRYDPTRPDGQQYYDPGQRGNRGDGGYRMDRPGGQGPRYGDGGPIYGNPPPIYGGRGDQPPGQMYPLPNFDPNGPRIQPMPYPGGPGQGGGMPPIFNYDPNQAHILPYRPDQGGGKYTGPLMDDGSIPDGSSVGRNNRPDPRTLDENGNVMAPGQTRGRDGGMHTHDWRGRNDPRYGGGQATDQGPEGWGWGQGGHDYWKSKNPGVPEQYPNGPGGDGQDVNNGGFWDDNGGYPGFPGGGLNNPPPWMNDWSPRNPDGTLADPRLEVQPGGPGGGGLQPDVMPRRGPGKGGDVAPGMGGGSYYPNNVNDMYGGPKRTRQKSGFGDPMGMALNGAGMVAGGVRPIVSGMTNSTGMPSMGNPAASNQRTQVSPGQGGPNQNIGSIYGSGVGGGRYEGSYGGNSTFGR